jgi:uncharacterized membrane protein
MIEKINRSKSIFGYYLPNNAFSISIVSIFAALTCIITMTILIPIPATGGYINIGDVAVMLSGLIFGPIVGFLSGGIGSALADILLGFPIWAPATLIIKGLEGFIVGLISNPRIIKNWRSIYDITATIIGGSVMVSGYFIVEAFIFNLGIGTALGELPGNLFQFGFGAISSIILIVVLRLSILNSTPTIFEKLFVSIETRYKH